MLFVKNPGDVEVLRKLSVNIARALIIAEILARVRRQRSGTAEDSQY
jgi:hypothetical protein